MAPDALATLSALFRASTIDDHQEILELANAALEKTPDDLEVQKVRLVALLKLDKFTEALQEAGPSITQSCPFEVGYAFYKAGNLKKAASVLQQEKKSTLESIRHLSAQIAYRDERFSDALRIYEDIIHDESAGSKEKDEVLINATASQAQLGWQGNDSSGTHSSSEDTFELAYNSACSYMATGDYTRALMLLQKAIKLCDSSEYLSDEEKTLERAPLIIQQAVVRAKLQQLEDALRLLKSQTANPGSLEPETRALLDYNLALLDIGELNPFLEERILSRTSLKSDHRTLFSFQKVALRGNERLVGFRTKKSPAVRAKAGDSPSKKNPPNLSRGVIHASVLQTLSRYAAGTKRPLMLTVSNQRTKQIADVGNLLTVIQIYAKEKKITTATDTLLRFCKASEISHGEGQERFCPGLVALKTKLYDVQARRSAANFEFASAIQYWKEAGRSSDQARSLLREAGLRLLKSAQDRDMSMGGEAFKMLSKTDRGDDFVSTGMIAAFGEDEDGQGSLYIQQLPVVDRLAEVANLNNLLSNGVATTSAIKSDTTKRVSHHEAGKTLTKRRKRKLPKDVDPAKKQDPERWLPLRDRSSFRPKGKKGKKKVTDTMQGGLAREEEIIQLVGDAGAVKVEKAPVSNSASKKKKRAKR